MSAPQSQRSRGSGNSSRGRGRGHGYHRHGKNQHESFEEEGPAGSGKSSYDILAQKCGGVATTLKQSAYIRRLTPNCKVHKDISRYVTNSCDGQGLTVKHIFKISRHDERNEFKKHFRMMLWHGTSPSAISGIIQTGFRLGTGGWFGGGVYFADRIAMSSGYAQSTAFGTKLFILAEVAPGKAYKAHHIHSDYTKAPQGFDGVKGMGGQIPNWSKNCDYNGAILPCGETITNPRYPQYDLPYSEYIVYDPNRIIIRFVVEC